MNTLFNTMFENEEASHYQNGVYLRPRTYDLQESNVHLKLTIVDTVGFGDQINKEERYKNCLLLRPASLFCTEKPNASVRWTYILWLITWPLNTNLCYNTKKFNTFWNETLTHSHSENLDRSVSVKLLYIYGDRGRINFIKALEAQISYC